MRNILIRSSHQRAVIPAREPPSLALVPSFLATLRSGGATTPKSVTTHIRLTFKRPEEGLLLVTVHDAWQLLRRGEAGKILSQYVRFALRRRDAYAYEEYFLSALKQVIAKEAQKREEQARRILIAARNRPVRDQIKRVLTPFTICELDSLLSGIVEDVLQRLKAAVRAGRRLKVQNLRGYSFVLLTLPEKSRARCVCTVDYQGAEVYIHALQSPKEHASREKRRLRPERPCTDRSVHPRVRQRALRLAS